MHNPQTSDIYYGDYLQISSLTRLQHPQSAKMGKESHDETLFIIVHQVYELWFKQIIHELKSMRVLLSSGAVSPQALATIHRRLQRIIKIQDLMHEQLGIMETMDPVNFLEFRDLLLPASGFQSVQFREIETLLGLPTASHLPDTQEEKDNKYLEGIAKMRSRMLSFLSSEDRAHLKEVGQHPSLFDLLGQWLASYPFSSVEGFHFWQEYRRVAEQALTQDRLALKAFQALFDDKAYQRQVDQGKRRLSQGAMLGALFIYLHQEHSSLIIPHQILTALVDFDEMMIVWRYRHTLMAHRMLGTKIGTGGSSGHHYLKMAADQARIFGDLFDIPSFLIPKAQIPPLSPQNQAF